MSPLTPTPPPEGREGEFAEHAPRAAREGRYVGRFAPSPTGPLHAGSLVAALGSYLDAKSQDGQWLLRMEDVDAPRCNPTHADTILAQLQAHGFEWDGAVLYQSARAGAYQQALDTLIAIGSAYACGCSRKEISDSAVQGLEGPVYPGTCRNGLRGKSARAWRVRVQDARLCFEDRRLGQHCQNLQREIGDFVVLRADGYFAYQLAMVVDDAAQGVTDVVRGTDLLLSTPRQLHLQTLLGLPHPRYLHLPLVLNAAGQKLSKQTLAPALDVQQATRNLQSALAVLGLVLPDELIGAPVERLLNWAVEQWLSRL